jgi:predicted ATPase
MSSVAIRSIEFENYRSLKKARLEFGPLTVLVGGNGTGKSSVLRALMWDQFGLRKEDVTDRAAKRTIQLRIVHQSGELNIRSGGGGGASGPPLGARQLLHLDLDGMRAPLRLQAARVLATNGQNMANVMSSLTRVRQQELSERFCALVPLYADVDVQALSDPGHHTLRFQDRWSKVWYLPQDVSDGTMLMFAYLLLLHQEPQVDLIAIEEPERGLHPYLLGQLVQFLRAMAQGKIGDRPVQIVAATHSAEFLNHLEPDEVRFLTRDESDGSTTIERVKSGAPDWRRAFTEYDSALGSMWLSGGLGGVPGR